MMHSQGSPSLQQAFLMERAVSPAQDCRGFTLVELIIAVGIIGFLALLAIPQFLGFIDKAKIARAVAEIHALAKAIDAYKNLSLDYPTEGLRNTLEEMGLGGRLDPWGNPYTYLRIGCGAAACFGGGGGGASLENDHPDKLVARTGWMPFSEIWSFGLLGEVPSAYAAPGGGGQGGGGQGGGGGGMGQTRKDHFLVPINSDYDLYSKGKDSDSVPPLGAQKSLDDIVRANEGGFVGLAANF